MQKFLDEMCNHFHESRICLDFYFSWYEQILYANKMTLFAKFLLRTWIGKCWKFTLVTHWAQTWLPCENIRDRWEKTKEMDGTTRQRTHAWLLGWVSSAVQVRFLFKKFFFVALRDYTYTLSFLYLMILDVFVLMIFNISRQSNICFCYIIE